MARDKRSFFERLTGTVSTDEYEEFEDDFAPQQTTPPVAKKTRVMPVAEQPVYEEPEPEEEGQLSVDVYQTPTDIVIKAVVAGVKPDELDVAITRDMVTIRGERQEVKEAADENYFHQELYWGRFSRTILLPAEIEVEGAEAQEKHGVLVIRLPKIDKDRQTKLKVKS